MMAGPDTISFAPALSVGTVVVSACLAVVVCAGVVAVVCAGVVAFVSPFSCLSVSLLVCMFVWSVCLFYEFLFS